MIKELLQYKFAPKDEIPANRSPRAFHFEHKSIMSFLGKPEKNVEKLKFAL